MKKIYKKLLIGILCLCLFTSCKSNKQRAGGERTSTEETKSTEILKGSNAETTESKEPRTTSETETAKEKNYKNLIEEDGAYMASIIASDKGEVNEYNMASVYEVQLDEDVIIVKGSFNIIKLIYYFLSHLHAPYSYIQALTPLLHLLFL